MPEARNPEMLARAPLRAREKENRNPEMMLAGALLRAREKENMVSYFPTIKGAEIRSPLPACATVTDIAECLQIIETTRTRQPKPRARVRARVRQPMIPVIPSQEMHGIPTLQEMEVALTNPLFVLQETETTVANPILVMANPGQFPEEQRGRGRGGSFPQSKKKSSLWPLMKMR